MKKQIKMYDVQAIELPTSLGKAFEYISTPGNLPGWTSAFKEADEKSALLVTPNGELKISLRTITNQSGTIDWYMTMPDGSVAKAFSRLTDLPNGNVLYSFVLLAPPVPIEQVEGTLEQQKQILSTELERLAKILS